MLKLLVEFCVMKVWLNHTMVPLHRSTLQWTLAYVEIAHKMIVISAALLFICCVGQDLRDTHTVLGFYYDSCLQERTFVNNTLDQRQM